MSPRAAYRSATSSALAPLLPFFRGFCLFCCLALAACTDGDPRFDASDRGLLSIDYSAQPQLVDGVEAVPIQKGQLLVGEVGTTTVTIQNLGQGPLTITGLELRYDRPTPVDEAAPALRLGAVRRGDEVAEPAGALVLLPKPDGADLTVEILYTRYDDPYPREARLVFGSDSLDAATRQVSIRLRTVEGSPVATASPQSLDFAHVVSGAAPKKTVTLTNTGTDTLEVASILLQGHPDFRLFDGETSYAPGEVIAFDPPLLVAPSGTRPFGVSFEPMVPSPAEGTVIFYTNDPDRPSGLPVALSANDGLPCIQINPKKVTFGAKLVGGKSSLPVELVNCGPAELEVSALFLAESSSGDYALATSTPKLPFAIPVNGTRTVDLTFDPSLEASLDELGLPIPETGTLVVESNAFVPVVEIGVEGFGTWTPCPTAVATVQEGQSVEPQTTLHLSGSQSFGPVGPIAEWTWTVEQPQGSVSGFQPSASFPEPTFETNVAGLYAFTLEVTDEQGVTSCVPAKTEVLVIPSEAIHIELLWTTPGDPDEADEGPEAGSDLDLHFVHTEYASMPDKDGDGMPDGWFDPIFDTFWFNAEPNWGTFDPNVDDNPGLDRDDTDGAGPENLNLNIPENVTYRIGVHYWDDHDYGPAYATIRVYIYKNLVIELTDVKLSQCDMWDVGTITWPSGKVELTQDPGGGYDITPQYASDFFDNCH